jgi:hypothetical protein
VCVCERERERESSLELYNIGQVSNREKRRSIKRRESMRSLESESTVEREFKM